MAKKNGQNGNKALQAFLGLIVLAGAVLGLTAFILHFTAKKNCSEGYKDDPNPTPVPPGDFCATCGQGEGSYAGDPACTNINTWLTSTAGQAALNTALEGVGVKCAGGKCDITGEAQTVKDIGKITLTGDLGATYTNACCGTPGYPSCGGTTVDANTAAMLNSIPGPYKGNCPNSWQWTNGAQMTGGIAHIPITLSN